ncbi:hypothetical protein ACFX2I_045792 [Malus domestica]
MTIGAHGDGGSRFEVLAWLQIVQHNEQKKELGWEQIRVWDGSNWSNTRSRKGTWVGAFRVCYDIVD